MQEFVILSACAGSFPNRIPQSVGSAKPMGKFGENSCGSIGFTKFPPGENRNLDLRRDFHKRLDKTSISATTIFNGAFADMLTGKMPLILFKLERALYWGDAEQRMDFTTMNDTAAFTASAALDPSTPRFLRISGDPLSARELTAVVSEVTVKKFRLFLAGGLGMLGTLINVACTVAPGEKELYPAWQGMQYMRNMFGGRARLEPRQRSLSQYSLDDCAGCALRTSS